MLRDIHSFKPDFSIILGDFNVRLNEWWFADTQISEGSEIDSFTTSCGFKQIISEPTHILKYTSACTDLKTQWLDHCIQFVIIKLFIVKLILTSYEISMGFYKS